MTELKRFAEKRMVTGIGIYDEIVEDPEGEYVLYKDAVEAIKDAVKKERRGYPEERKASDGAKDCAEAIHKRGE